MTLEPLVWLHLLGRQTVALSLGVVLVLLLRPWLVRRFGAGVAYAAWTMLPLLVVAASVPASEPVQNLRAQVMTRIEPWLGGAAPTPPEPTLPLWPWLLLALWAVGLLIFAARLVWLQRQFMRGARLEGNLWVGPPGSGPALVGVFRPRLLLPADFERRFDAGQRTLVLAHEAVHRQRADNHWNALAAGLCLLHWFNPLAWLALRRLRADQELACDASVMARHPGSEATYARALLLTQDPDASVASPLCASWQSAHPLVERIEMLKNPPARKRRLVLGYAFLACVSLSGLALAQAVTSPGDPKANIDLQMDFTIEEMLDSGLSRHRVKTNLRLASGKHFTLRGAPTPPSPSQPQPPITSHETPKPPLTPNTELEIWADDLGDGRVSISAVVSRGEPPKPLYRPRMITNWGETARLEIGPDPTKNNGKLSISVTPTRVKPAQP